MKKDPKHLFTVLALFTMLAASNAHAVTVLGALTCQQINDAKTVDPQGIKKAAVFWTLGYLSGAATVTQKEILDQVQAEEIADFVIDYCRLNPTKHMQSAASAFEFVLKKRKGL